MDYDKITDRLLAMIDEGALESDTSLEWLDDSVVEDAR